MSSEHYRNFLSARAVAEKHAALFIAEMVKQGAEWKDLVKVAGPLHENGWIKGLDVDAHGALAKYGETEALERLFVTGMARSVAPTETGVAAGLAAAGTVEGGTARVVGSYIYLDGGKTTFFGTIEGDEFRRA